MTSATVGQQTTWLAIGNAIIEEAEVRGRFPTPEMTERLRGLSARPLPADVRAAWRATFGGSVDAVRLHLGPGADELLATLGAPACCLRHHILLARSALVCPTLAAQILLHELTHYVVGRRRDQLRCWDASEHAALSAEACAAYGRQLEALASSVDLSWTEFLRGIENASSNMDFRGRVASIGITLKYLTGIAKGEGPAHGEGLNYTSTSMAANETLNAREQTRHVQIAAGEFLEDKPLLEVGPYRIRPRTHRSRHMGSTVGGVSLMEREWIKSLANAMHVAQDRASHREGTKGYGHDDPRCDNREWSPDKKMHEHSLGKGWDRCNEAAHNKALNNSFDVVFEFLKEVYRRQEKVVSLPLAARRTLNCP